MGVFWLLRFGGPDVNCSRRAPRAGAVHPCGCSVVGWMGQVMAGTEGKMNLKLVEGRSQLGNFCFEMLRTAKVMG